MAFLTFNGVEVQVSTQGASENEPTRVGESVRAFDGGLRSTVRAVKRSWTFVLPPITQADLATLRATFETGAFVTVGGDALGATIPCEVRITAAPYVENGTGFLRTPTVTITEV